MNISHAIPGTNSRQATITILEGRPVQVSWGRDLRICSTVVEAVQYLAANDCPDWTITRS
jgi:hypothetical protein